MQHEPNPRSEPAPPDPHKDQDAAARPARIGFVLKIVSRMIGFGRHLAATVTQRSQAPNFSAIAVCFGTARVAAIAAHLQRGILRAIALENVLRARLAAGRDLDLVDRALPPRTPKPAAPSAPPDATPPSAAPATLRTATRRPSGWDDPELFMPTLEDLEAQVRRRPIGRTILDICLDLGIVPGFCLGAAWNDLFECLHDLGGSLNRMRLERERRWQAFRKECDNRPLHLPRSDFRWWDLGKDGARQVLGFLFGEDPVNPFDPPPAAATATDPP